ncbi:hypothetical protein ABPG72_018607 [Tetrahymena utriculariae]
MQRLRIASITKAQSRLLHYDMGAICYSGFLYIEKVENRLNTEAYQEILERFFSGSANVLLLPEKCSKFRFQQDNAPPHKPIKIKEFIKENGFIYHSHPPNSTDLNPIELVWSKMKGIVELKSPSNKSELEESIFETFDQIDDLFVQHCIEHLKQYLPEVIQAQGDYPKQFLEIQEE